MRCIVDVNGLYTEQTESLVQFWDNERRVMVCGIIIVGYWQSLSIEAAEQLADRLEQLVVRGEALDMYAAESTIKTGTPLCTFDGGFPVGRCYRTSIHLARPHMQLSLSETARLVDDMRNCIAIALALMKSISRYSSLTINGKILERILDTEVESLRNADLEHRRKWRHHAGKLASREYLKVNPY